MLTEIYIQALLVDEELADQVRYEKGGRDRPGSTVKGTPATAL
jgi:hypothetical protein